jgi:hypothetical protein
MRLLLDEGWFWGYYVVDWVIMVVLVEWGEVLAGGF